MAKVMMKAKAMLSHCDTWPSCRVESCMVEGLRYARVIARAAGSQHIMRKATSFLMAD